MCGIVNPGGYHFLPLYVITHKDGTPVQRWVSKVLGLYHTLQKENKDWGKMAEDDTDHRLLTFLSTAVIDRYLM